MKFRVVDSTAEIIETGFYLIHDNWDDWFTYEIAYWLYIKEENAVTFDKIGRVRIGVKNQIERISDLPEEFSCLSEEYFSLGFDVDYYDNIKNYNRYRDELLTSLRDMAYDLDIYQLNKAWDVSIQALLRDYTESMVKGQLHRMATGGKRLTAYDFKYYLPERIEGEPPVMIDFKVDPEDKPSSNIHVLIGKNGIGKTTIIKKMIYALEKLEESDDGYLLMPPDQELSNVIFVSFSAFDMPILPDDLDQRIPYKFIGLISDNKTVKSRDKLTEEFIGCTYKFYRNDYKMILWEKVLDFLKSDATFAEQDICDMVSFETKYILADRVNKERKGEKREIKREYLKELHEKRAFKSFSRLSYGHKIILLTLANLVDLVEEKTLVIMDEPEEHLHPPLVATFIQALNHILTYRNGVGIIATHSPVIAQEIPRKCVWILNRVGDYVLPRRPEFETYGENLEKLMTEIFGFEVYKSGFHKEIEKAVEKYDSYEVALASFGNNLGSEAKSFLRAYLFDKGY